MVRLTDRPDMTFDVYRGRKTTIQQQQQQQRLNKCTSKHIYEPNLMVLPLVLMIPD